MSITAEKRLSTRHPSVCYESKKTAVNETSVRRPTTEAKERQPTKHPYTCYVTVSTETEITRRRSYAESLEQWDRANEAPFVKGNGNQ